MENWFYIALAAAAALLLAAAIWKLLRRANPWSRAPYERQAYFLSPAEKAFYDVLDELVGEDVVICPKPAVREVLRVRGNVRRDRQKYFNWISQKHVDFVLCDRETMQILCAVELDDSSHERADRRQRDAFMDKAFRKAKLPLFHIPCRKSYGAKELNELCSFLCQDLLVLEDEEEGPACPAGTFGPAALPGLRGADGAAHRQPRAASGGAVLWLPQFSTVPPHKAVSRGIKKGVAWADALQLLLQEEKR